MQLLVSFEVKNYVDIQSSQRQCWVLSYSFSVPNPPRLYRVMMELDLRKLHIPLSADNWLTSSTGGWKTGGGQLPCSFLFASRSYQLCLGLPLNPDGSSWFHSPAFTATLPEPASLATPQRYQNWQQCLLLQSVMRPRSKGPIPQAFRFWKLQILPCVTPVLVGAATFCNYISLSCLCFSIL